MCFALEVAWHLSLCGVESLDSPHFKLVSERSQNLMANDMTDMTPRFGGPDEALGEAQLLHQHLIASAFGKRIFSWHGTSGKVIFQIFQSFWVKDGENPDQTLIKRSSRDSILGILGIQFPFPALSVFKKNMVILPFRPLPTGGPLCGHVGRRWGLELSADSVLIQC